MTFVKKIPPGILLCLLTPLFSTGGKIWLLADRGKIAKVFLLILATTGQRTLVGSF